MLINNKSLIKTINKLNLTDDEREKFNKISEDDKGNFLTELPFQHRHL